jgi:transcriptional regulator with XRE-family HTH domain
MTPQTTTSTITLGDAIRVAISHTGLTLEQLGAILDVTPKTLSRWQKDLTVPKADDLARLAVVTGYDFDFFGSAIRSSVEMPPISGYVRRLALVPPMLGQQTLDFDIDPPPARSAARPTLCGQLAHAA